MVLIFTTAPDLKTAERLAYSLIRQKLAACVSVKTGFTSVYRWEGKIKKTKETLLLIKSSKAKFIKLKKYIGRIHPYEVPEIIALPVTQAAPEYLAWLHRALK